MEDYSTGSNVVKKEEKKTVGKLIEFVGPQAKARFEELIKDTKPGDAVHITVNLGQPNVPNANGDFFSPEAHAKLVEEFNKQTFCHDNRFVYFSVHQDKTAPISVVKVQTPSLSTTRPSFSVVKERS